MHDNGIFWRWRLAERENDGDEDGKSVKTDYMSYDEWKERYVDDKWHNEDNKLYFDITD